MNNQYEHSTTLKEYYTIQIRELLKLYLWNTNLGDTIHVISLVPTEKFTKRSPAKSSITDRSKRLLLRLCFQPHFQISKIVLGEGKSNLSPQTQTAVEGKVEKKYSHEITYISRIW